MIMTFAYYSNYADSYDIDCFFRIGDLAFHFASNGQPIPKFISRNTNWDIQRAVSELLPDIKEEIVTNRNIILYLIRKEFEGMTFNSEYFIEEYPDIDILIENYAESFEEMARIGFVSMDLDKNNIFHIIARPIGQKIPEAIRQMLPETNLNELELMGYHIEQIKHV